MARRQAAKAKHDAYQAREEAKRGQVEAQLAEEATKRTELLREADRLSGLAAEKEKQAGEHRKVYDDLVKNLSTATTWDDIQVR
jgi:hypothetical protein